MTCCSDGSWKLGESDGSHEMEQKCQNCHGRQWKKGPKCLEKWACQSGYATRGVSGGWKPTSHPCFLEGPGGHSVHQSDKECAGEKGLSIIEKPVWLSILGQGC